jgi:hypothetical protein
VELSSSRSESSIARRHKLVDSETGQQLQYLETDKEEDEATVRREIDPS